MTLERTYKAPSRQKLFCKGFESKKNDGTNLRHQRERVEAGRPSKEPLIQISGTAHRRDEERG
jgi:hypothetical protein